MNIKLLAAVLVVLSYLIIVDVAPAGQNASPYLLKADKFYSQKKFSEAIPLYRSLLSSSSPDTPRSAVSLKLADCYFQVGDYRNALVAYREALPGQAAADRPQTQYWIGFCSLMQGKNAEAIDEFLKIPEAYPSSGMWVSTAYYWAGRACERMGNKDRAAEFYRKAGGTGRSTQERFAMEKADGVKKGSSIK